MTGAPIATDPQVQALLARAETAVAIGVSGGKDSQAAALATVAHLDSIGHAGACVLIHRFLGLVEWEESLPVCEDLARHLGLELLVVRRRAGGLMERWEARWASSVRRYAALETVTLVLPWSTPSMRFCTSELKTQVIGPALRRRFPGRPIVNVTGVRREESAARAKLPVADLDLRGSRKDDGYHASAPASMPQTSPDSPDPSIRVANLVHYHADNRDADAPWVGDDGGCAVSAKTTGADVTLWWETSMARFWCSPRCSRRLSLEVNLKPRPPGGAGAFILSRTLLWRSMLGVSVRGRLFLPSSS